MISSLNVLDTVEICVTSVDLRKSYYRTKIQDIGLNNTIYTMVPTSESGRPVLFFKDQTYELYAKNKNGIVAWKINYLGTEDVDNFPACKFQAIKGPEVTQRREYYRQPVSVPLEFFITQSGEDIDPNLLYTGQIVDLSGGGCAFMSDANISLQSKILAKFDYRGTHFEFVGVILGRIDFKESRSDWDYKYRVSWINAKERVIDLLIKLVFDHQREMLAASGLRGGDRFV